MPLKFYSKLSPRPAMNTVNPEINIKIQFNQQLNEEQKRMDK
jgi:hypothetical protein